MLLVGRASLLMEGKEEGERWGQRTDKKLQCLLGSGPQKTLAISPFISQAVLVQQVGI